MTTRNGVFQRSCPTCGRRLMIQVEHWGQQVTCGHCRRAFVAGDRPPEDRDGTGVGDTILDRAERLLALFDASDRNRPACQA